MRYSSEVTDSSNLIQSNVNLNQESSQMFQAISPVEGQFSNLNPDNFIVSQSHILLNKVSPESINISGVKLGQGDTTANLRNEGVTGSDYLATLE